MLGKLCIYDAAKLSRLKEKMNFRKVSIYQARVWHNWKKTYRLKGIFRTEFSSSGPQYRKKIRFFDAIKTFLRDDFFR